MRISPIRAAGRREPELEDADRRLAAELSAYGGRALSPSEKTIARIERPVLDAFDRQAGQPVATGQSQRHRVAAPTRETIFGPFSFGLPAGLHRRPSTIAALVLGLAVAFTGVAAAQSGPGHTFYPVRLAFETMALPPTESPARITSQLQRLHQRIVETREATAHEDGDAVEDALAAYRGTLDEVVDLGRRHPGNAGRTINALQTDARELEALAPRASARARATILQTIVAIHTAERHFDPTSFGKAQPGANTPNFAWRCARIVSTAGSCSRTALHE